MKYLLFFGLFYISIAGSAQKLYDAIELKNGEKVNCQILRISRADTLIQFAVPENGQMVIKKLSLQCVVKYNWPGQNQANHYKKKYNVNSLQDGEYYRKDCFAPQESNTAKLSPEYEWQSKAGKELEKASNLLATGISITSVGILTAFLGPKLIQEPNYTSGNSNQISQDIKKYNNGVDAMIYTGCGLIFVGTIVNLTSIAHFKKAGLIMISNKSMNLSVKPTGLSLAFNF